MKIKVIYPGTFDPITLGHLDIINKITKIFDFIVIAIFENTKKKPLFSIKERIKLTKTATKKFKTIKKVITFNSLLVQIAKSENINYIIRGIRTSLDFEYELNMFNINKKMYPKLENISFFPSPKCSYISSSLVKEIVRYGGSVKSYVPKSVHLALIKKYRNIPI
ncbi:MAG: pantetheine-phosphate adenylyltransferase [Buchnera aphidicola (Melaphis rhois)]